MHEALIENRNLYSKHQLKSNDKKTFILQEGLFACPPLGALKLPMKSIGAQKSAAREKQVTNETDWRPKKCGERKTGHQ